MSVNIDSIFPKAHTNDLPEVAEAITDARQAWNRGSFSSAVERLRYAASISAIAHASKVSEDRILDSLPMDSIEANELVASNRAVVLAKSVLELDALLAAKSVSELPFLLSEPIGEDISLDELESISVAPINSAQSARPPSTDSPSSDNYEAFPLSSNSGSVQQTKELKQSLTSSNQQTGTETNQQVPFNSPPPEPLPWSVLPTSREGWPFVAAQPVLSREATTSLNASMNVTTAVEAISENTSVSQDFQHLTLQPPGDAFLIESPKTTGTFVETTTLSTNSNRPFTETVESPVFQQSSIHSDYDSAFQNVSLVSKPPTKRPEPIASYRPQAQQNTTYLYRARPSPSRSSQRQWEPPHSAPNTQSPTVVPPVLNETVEAKPASIRFSRIPTPRPASSPIPVVLLPRPAKAPSFELTIDHEPIDLSQFEVFTNLAHATRDWLMQTTRAISLGPGHSVNSIALVAVLQGSIGIYLSGHNDVLVTLGPLEVYLLTLDPSIAESLIVVGGYEGAKVMLLNSSAVARMAKSSPWVIDQLTPGKDELQTYALRLLIAETNLPKKRARTS